MTASDVWTMPWGGAGNLRVHRNKNAWSVRTEPRRVGLPSTDADANVTMVFSGRFEDPGQVRVELLLEGQAIIDGPIQGQVRWWITAPLQARTGHPCDDPRFSMEVLSDPADLDMPRFPQDGIERMLLGDLAALSRAWEDAQPGYVAIGVANARTVRDQTWPSEVPSGNVTVPDMEGFHLSAGERLMVLRALRADPDTVARLERRNAELVAALEALVGNIATVMDGYRDEPDDAGAASLPVGEGQHVTMYTFGDIRRAIALLPKDD